MVGAVDFASRYPVLIAIVSAIILIAIIHWRLQKNYTYGDDRDLICEACKILHTSERTLFIEAFANMFPSATNYDEALEAYENYHNYVNAASPKTVGQKNKCPYTAPWWLYVYVYSKKDFKTHRL